MTVVTVVTVKNRGRKANLPRRGRGGVRSLNIGPPPRSVCDTRCRSGSARAGEETDEETRNDGHHRCRLRTRERTRGCIDPQCRREPMGFYHKGTDEWERQQLERQREEDEIERCLDDDEYLRLRRLTRAEWEESDDYNDRRAPV